MIRICYYKHDALFAIVDTSLNKISIIQPKIQCSLIKDFCERWKWRAASMSVFAT